MRSRWTRLLPIMLVTFIISFLDRTNIGFALPGMGLDIGVTATVAGFASGFLFIGYGLSQPVGGWLADRGLAKNLVTCLMLAWGLAGAAQGFIQSDWQLVVVRFLLGAAEGGIFPAFLVIIRNWFNLREQSRANGMWQLCYPLAAMISGPIAGYILEATSWRWLLIIEGVFPLVFLAAWHFGTADSPAKAKWLTPADRDAVIAHASHGRTAPARTEPFGSAAFRAQLKRPVIVFFTLAAILWNVGFLAIVIWLPSALSEHDLSQVEIGWLTAIPYAVAIAALLTMTRLADRTGRRWQICVAGLALAAAALLIGSLVAPDSLVVTIVSVSIAAMGVYGGWPVYWSIPPSILPPSVHGAVLGAVNGVAVLGAFGGPYIVGWVRDMTGTFSAGMVTVAGCLLGAGVCIALARIDRAAQALDDPTAASTKTPA
ncbi:MAG: MFS transporter [Propionibacteriaceae bacterium]|jgi:MFS family permease|nr:MFS transporter [Propionibacteriaceae bacterium]